MKNFTQAVILCGGLGTRLRPITNTIPKPMVMINKKPFLWFLMDKLSSPPNNIKRFLLLTGYLQEHIIDFFNDGKEFGWDIKYSCGEKSWETGKRIWEARDLLDSKFLLCYSDNFAQVVLENGYKVWRKNNSVITLLLSNKKKGNIKIKNNDNVEYIKGRKDGYDYVDLGFMLCDKKSLIVEFNLIENAPEIDFSTLLEKLSFKNKISGYLLQDSYKSIGDLERLSKTKDYLYPKRIILIDRDGVINKKANKGKYITCWDKFIFIKDTIRALKKLSKNGFKFIIISNQAGIATGDLKQHDLENIHEKMINFFKKKNIEILDIFISYDHWQSNSFRRKPNPGMFFEASEKYNFRLDKTFYIGDDPRDCLAAERAGCGRILIGENIQDNEIEADYKAMKLSELTDCLLSKFKEYEVQILKKFLK